MTALENIAYIENIIIELRTLYDINDYDFKITYKVGDYVYSNCRNGVFKLIGIEHTETGQFNKFIARDNDGDECIFSPEIELAFGYKTRLATNREIVKFRYENILREMKLKGL